MGVHGLTTYLKEHHRKLSTTFTLPSDSEDHIIIVVDGWSFIYELHRHSNLPWVYGGECDEFHRLVTVVVRAWISVGLKVHFVFDGAYPKLKFSTQVLRLNQSHVQPSLLFFRTSPASRSTYRFLNETRVMPPLLYTTCLHALNAVRESTNSLQIEFADEEGDPYAVELAARLGGYVVGNDSDFVVLNADGYLGYIPLGEMFWQSPLTSLEELKLNGEDTDFQQVRRSKAKKKSSHGVTGIIPPDSGELVLSLTAYSPVALAAHLKIPHPLLPLLGSLVGNDYTSPAESTSRKNVQQLFFAKQLSLSQRIDYVASTLQAILNPASHVGKKPKHQIDNVMDLIEKAVNSLLSRLIGVLGSGEIDAIVNKIVEAALQYAIPKEDTPAIWPSDFCALHEPEACPLLSFFSRKLETTLSDFVDEENDDFRNAVAIRAKYIEAYRRGNFTPDIIDILSFGTFWPSLFLENPDIETVSRSIGRPLREWGYAILDDAVGLPPNTRESEETQDGEAGATEDEEELIDVVESDASGDDLLAPLKGELDRLHSADVRRAYEATVGSVASSSRPHSRLHLHPPIVTEYVRRGTRVAEEIVVVQPLRHFLSFVPLPEDGDFESSLPLILRAEEHRLTVFLRALESDNTLVRALPSDRLLPVVALRWVIRRIHTRAEETGSREREKERWTRREAQCFLGAFDWAASRPQCNPEHQPPPTVTDRNVQLAAQVLSALESAEHLSQILLLTSSISSSVHLFSGKAFHNSLIASPGQKGVESAITEALFEAASYGLDTAFGEEQQEKPKKARKAAKVGTPGPATRSHSGPKGTEGLFQLLGNVDA